MKSEQRIWGKSGQFEATMRVGVVGLAVYVQRSVVGGHCVRWGFAVGAVGARLDRDWMAIGIIPNLSNCPLVSMSLSQSFHFEF
jgi:hypothetical protein